MCHNSHASLEWMPFSNITFSRKHLLIPPIHSSLQDLLGLAKEILQNIYPVSARGNEGKRDQCFQKCFQVYTIVENPELHICLREEDLVSGLQGRSQLCRGHTSAPSNTQNFLILHFFFGFLPEDVTHCCKDLGNKMHC